MKTLTAGLIANRREISVQPENRIKKITKTADGGLAVEYGSGASGALPAGEDLIQAYAIYSIIAEL